LYRRINASSIADSINQLRSGEESFKNTADSAKGIVKKVDSARLAVINVGYVVAILCAVAGVVGSLLNKGKLCMM
jgi:hypothetical protein